MNESASHSKPKARILVVDDHPLLREGVRQLINRQSDLVACGEAADLPGATTAVETCQPDLVLLDLRLGSGDTLEFVKSVKVRFPHVSILILSQHDEALYAERVLRAGASGYVMKEEAAQEVLSAIRAVLAGELYVSRKMAILLLHKLLRGRPTAPDNRLAGLSDRELQVFQMLGAGLGSRRIAAELHLSIKTVETHRESLKHKLGLPTGAELVRHATRWVESSGAHPAPPEA